MSDPTYQRVRPDADNLHDLDWDSSDDRPAHDLDPVDLERLRASPASVSPRTSAEISEVLRRFPRPGARQPTRGRQHFVSKRSFVILGMVLATSVCAIGAWYGVTHF